MVRLHLTGEPGTTLPARHPFRSGHGLAPRHPFQAFPPSPSLARIPRPLAKAPALARRPASAPSAYASEGLLRQYVDGVHRRGPTANARVHSAASSRAGSVESTPTTRVQSATASSLASRTDSAARGGGYVAAVEASVVASVAGPRPRHSGSLELITPQSSSSRLPSHLAAFRLESELRCAGQRHACCAPAQALTRGRTLPVPCQTTIGTWPSN